MIHGKQIFPASHCWKKAFYFLFNGILSVKHACFIKTAYHQ